MRDINDDVPAFGGEEHARAEIEELTDRLNVGDLANQEPELDEARKRAEQELAAAREVVESLETGWDAETLAAEPVLYQGQADDCHFEQGDTRLWLSRTGIEDGEPFENTVSIEREIDGKWVTIAKYDGGALPEDERGKFVVEIEPGNAAMQEGGHVAMALRKLAEKLDFREEWEGEGPIIDDNGNTVGRWTFHDNN